MKLIAAARLRRAQESAVAARPYSEALARVADSLLTSEGVQIGPAEGAEANALIAVISSDRGQCGGYNTNIVRTAEQARASLERDGLSVSYFAIGKKAVDHFKRSKAPVAASSQENTPRLATIGLARTIAGRILADYRTGKIVKASIAYTRFLSAMSQRPAIEQLLPLVAPEGGRQETSGGAPELPTDYLIEPSREELVPVVLKSYVEAAVLHALLEAEASEQAARMTAMDSATKNAIEMIAAYTLEMNRARQAQITRELMDIVGGAEALRSAS